MSPEIIRKTPYSGFKADCWALGMILYYMISGGFPFTCRDEKTLFNAILRSTIPIDQKLSLNLRRLLRGMLTTDSILRYDIDDIINHEWCK
jgi:serine/threonine protein kinase